MDDNKVIIYILPVYFASYPFKHMMNTTKAIDTGFENNSSIVSFKTSRSYTVVLKMS